MSLSYLALGDSYTIGEQVPYSDNFPSQLCRQLRQKNIDIQLDRLIAVTGWTTDELAAAIASQPPHHNYDWVTLLIGVNNQYRGRSLDEYRWQFYSLLCQSILFARGQARRVIVLSIPDWGLTPFNTDRDPVFTSSQIDQYNEINHHFATLLGTHYLNVTESTRTHAKNPDYLAPDNLHYAASEYSLWAQDLAAIIFNASNEEE